ncbi:transposase, partial [Escherichia coli]|uniref:transposase n=1 Tax=Escherichia coli TaxID=562 RepID=UPI003CEDF6B0
MAGQTAISCGFRSDSGKTPPHTDIPPACFPDGGIFSIAPKTGCTPETLRVWLRQHERDTGGGDGGLTTAERQRLKELERENRELRRSNDILRQASAYFAKAEF